MSRIIAISDIHGCLEELEQLIDKTKYNPDKDRLLFLGDYVDKGKEPKAALEFVMKMCTTYGAEAVDGNHDSMFYHWSHNDDFKKKPYLRNRVGGLKTVSSFCPHIQDIRNQEEEAMKYIQEHAQEHLQFIEKLPSYIVVENYVFVHAGVDPSKEDWKNTSEHDFRWIREDFILNDNPFKETFVFGHSPTRALHKEEYNNNIWISGNKIGIDGGCVYGGQLNALMIEEDNITQTSVKSIYKNMFPFRA